MKRAELYDVVDHWLSYWTYASAVSTVNVAVSSVVAHTSKVDETSLQSEQQARDYVAGSWDESLRLWYRRGHPNNTPRGSAAVDDITEGTELKV